MYNNNKYKDVVKSVGIGFADPGQYQEYKNHGKLNRIINTAFWSLRYMDKDNDTMWEQMENDLWEMLSPLVYAFHEAMAEDAENDN